MTKSIQIYSPSEGVFGMNFNKMGGKLFENQTELTNEIVNKNPKFKKKIPSSIRSLINLIFNGERNLSKSMREALFTAIEPRFDKEQYDFEEFKNILTEKFRENFLERKDKKKRIGDVDYQKLLEATIYAREILIITLEPAEIHDSVLANKLKDELLEKTGIINKPSVIPGKYKFYFPKGSDEKTKDYIAIRFWGSLRAYAIDAYRLDEKLIDSELIKKNEEGIISTYSIDINDAIYPIVLTDYSYDNRAAFCVSYEPVRSQIPSVGQLSSIVLSNWMQYKFPELQNAKPYNVINLLGDKKNGSSEQ